MNFNGRFVSKCAAAVAIASLLAIPAAAQTGSGGNLSHINVDLSKIRIDNFGRVDANYYRGAQPQGRDYEDLAALGIKSVINLTKDDGEADERAMVESAGMAYFQIPMTTHAPPTTAELTDFMKIVNDPGNQPVYVHCVGGRHRTGVMTAVYRMSDDGWTSGQAFAEMKQYKFGADFLHSEFKEFVYGYHAQPASPLPQDVVAAVAKGAE